MKLRSASMKARGVSFAVEAIANFVGQEGFIDDEQAEQLFLRMERVVLSRINEFIPHYLVKVLCAFTEAGYGSGEFYDQVIARVLPAVMQANSTELYDRFDHSRQAAPLTHAMKYSDMVRFFEVYPQVTYIFDATMTSEVYSAFMAKLSQVIEEKRLPMEDLCRVLNILVRLSAYGSFDEQRTYNKILLRLRHSLHAIPREHFANTLASLIELQQPDLAKKLALILTGHTLFMQGRIDEDFKTDKEMI